MTTIEAPSIAAEEFRLAAFDLYRDIHKGIRAELFAVTAAAGSVDPGNDGAVGAVCGRWSTLVRLLASHAEHEAREKPGVVREETARLGRDVAAVVRDAEGRSLEDREH